MITIPCWNGDDGGFPEHGVFVLYDPADELQGLVAVVCLGRDQRLIEDQAHQFGRRRLLEVGDEMPGGFQAVLAFRFVADIGGLQREVDATGRGCPPGLAA